MDFVSTALVTLKQPKGFWEAILNAFKGATGTYILAVILLAFIIRIVLAFVDVFNKKINMKTMDINKKMKPELDAIQKKYGYDQRLVQQKTAEVQKKYGMSVAGSCLPMLLTFVLQMVVFLTLWNSLRAVSDFNIVEKYENIKNVYANVLELNDHVLYTQFEEGDELSLEISRNEEGKKVFKLIISNESGKRIASDSMEINTDIDNQTIVELLKLYTPEDTDAEIEAAVEAGSQKEAWLAAVKALADKTARDVYVETQENFLWIKNIYKSESLTSPLFTKSEIVNYLSKFYSAEEKEQEKEFKYEETIFKNIVEDNKNFDALRKEHNGYYILTIIAVVTSFLSIWLSNRLTNGRKKKEQKPGENPNPAASKLMYFVMPIIIGIFTFMYTSLFAVYLIIGQLVVMALTPLTTFIVRKWVASDAKKKQEKDVVVVDYRRK